MRKTEGKEAVAVEKPAAEAATVTLGPGVILQGSGGTSREEVASVEAPNTPILDSLLRNRGITTGKSLAEKLKEAEDGLGELNQDYLDFRARKLKDIERLQVENNALRGKIVELKTKDRVMAESVAPRVEKLLKENRELVDQWAKSENDLERIRSRPRFKGYNRVAGTGTDEPVIDPFKKEAKR